MADKQPCCPACVARLNELSEDNRDLHESNDWLQRENARLDKCLCEARNSAEHKRHGPLD